MIVLRSVNPFFERFGRIVVVYGDRSLRKDGPYRSRCRRVTVTPVSRTPAFHASSIAWAPRMRESAGGIDNRWRKRETKSGRGSA